MPANAKPRQNPGLNILATESAIDKRVSFALDSLNLARTQGEPEFERTRDFYVAYLAGIRDFIYFNSSQNSLDILREINNGIDVIKYLPFISSTMEVRN